MTVVIAAIAAIVLWAFWPTLKQAVAYGLNRAGVTVMNGAQVLVFAKPRPDSPAGVFSFTGVDVAHRFFGMVTQQEATIAPAAKPAESRIVMPD